MEIAKSLGAGLYKACCAAHVDGVLTDLRTPLTSICGSAGILRESGEALKEERRKELDVYKRQQ